MSPANELKDVSINLPINGQQNCKILVPKTGALVDVSILGFLFFTNILDYISRRTLILEDEKKSYVVTFTVLVTLVLL